MRYEYEQQQIADRARFLRDTEHHRMTIRQDDGIYRHIHVANPKNSSYHFNITTFPGYLTFTGDMGSYVFSRTRDMFEFHRIKWGRDIPCIDYSYWAEKAEAVDRHSGTHEFDEDRFKEAALRDFWNHDWPDHKTRRQEWIFYIRDIISDGHQDSGEAIRAMCEYSYLRDDGCGSLKTDHPFGEFWDSGSFTKPSFRLKWACWAIASTIRDYDLGGDRFTRQERHDKAVLAGGL